MKKPLIFLILFLSLTDFSLAQSGDNVEANVESSQSQQLIDNSNQSMNFNSKGAHIPRQFGGTPNIDHLNPYGFHGTQPTRPGNQQGAINFTAFQKTFSRDELERITKGEKFKVNAKNIKGVTVPRQNRYPTDTITIEVIQLPPDKNYESYGNITVWGKGKYDTTLGTIAKAALEAMDMDANILLIYGEGADRFLEGGGWSFMLGHASTYISDSEHTSGSSIGGIGYGKTKTGYQHAPWIQSWALREKASPVATINPEKVVKNLCRLLERAAEKN